MPQQSFTAAVDAWVLATEQRIEGVFKEAAQSVIEDVSDRTPVDTGYLRRSWTVSLDGPQEMRGKQGDGYGAPPISLVIAGAKIGDTITASFVANYAAYVEYGTHGRSGQGMVRLAAQAWPQHVNRAVLRAKAASRRP